MQLCIMLCFLICGICKALETPILLSKVLDIIRTITNAYKPLERPQNTLRPLKRLKFLFIVNNLLLNDIYYQSITNSRLHQLLDKCNYQMNATSRQVQLLTPSSLPWLIFHCLPWLTFNSSSSLELTSNLDGCARTNTPYFHNFWASREYGKFL